MLEHLSEEFDEMAMGRKNGNATGLANKLPNLQRDTRNVKKRGVRRLVMCAGIRRQTGEKSHQYGRQPPVGR